VRTTTSASPRGAVAIRAVRCVLSSHGIAGLTIDGIERESERLMAAVHWVEGPQLLDAGDEVDGWRVEVLRGHADGPSSSCATA